MNEELRECIFCKDANIFSQEYERPERTKHAIFAAQGQFWKHKPKKRTVQPGTFEEGVFGKYRCVKVEKDHFDPRWQPFTVEVLGVEQQTEPPSPPSPFFHYSSTITPTYTIPLGGDIEDFRDFAEDIGLNHRYVKTEKYEMASFGGLQDTEDGKPQRKPNLKSRYLTDLQENFVLYAAARIVHDESGLCVKLHWWKTHGIIFTVENFDFSSSKSNEILKDALSIFSHGRGRPSKHFTSPKQFDDALRQAILELSKKSLEPLQEDVAALMSEDENFTARTLRKWIDKSNWMHFSWIELVKAVQEDDEIARGRN